MDDFKTDLTAQVQQDQHKPHILYQEGQEQVHVPIPDTPTGVRHSKIKNSQPKQPYIPSMSGSKNKKSMVQMENQGALNPDAHMFFNQAVEEKTTVLLTI